MTDPTPASSPTGSSPPASSPPTGYAAAARELDAILIELDRSDIDVDQLAARVQRAAELIAFCRDRIIGARAQITQVVVDLGTTPPA